MSKRLWHITGELDDADLKSHVAETNGNEYPLVADPTEFTWDDFRAAVENGLIENVEVAAGTGGEI